MKTIFRHILLAAVLLARPAVMSAQSVYGDATSLFYNGRYEDALKMYDAAKVLEKDSSDFLLLIESHILRARKCLRIREEADRYYDAANREAALEGYEEIMKMNPFDPHVVARIADCRRQLARDAATRRETDDWNAATNGGTKDAYRHYLAAHPGERHARDAVARLDEMEKRARDEAMETGAVDAFLKYIGEYPDGLYATEVLAGLAVAEEEQCWIEARNIGSVDGCRTYLDRYPEGLHADDAQGIIDSIFFMADSTLWREAMRENTAEAYREYLDASAHKNYEKEALQALRLIKDSLDYITYMKWAEENFNRKEYKYALWKIEQVKLDRLSPELREKADEYLEKLQKKVRVIKRWERFKSHAEIGIGYRFGMFNLLSHTVPLHLKLKNEYDVVQFITGIEYTYYRKFYREYTLYDDKSDLERHRISAHQFSVPATFKFNFKRDKDFDNEEFFPYISLTGTFNYNFMGKCFEVHDSKMVNRTTYSGTATLGYSLGELMCFELFFRKDFRPVFAGRENIYRYDDHNERNNYGTIDRAISNTMYIGIAVMLHIPLFSE